MTVILYSNRSRPARACLKPTRPQLPQPALHPSRPPDSLAVVHLLQSVRRSSRRPGLWLCLCDPCSPTHATFGSGAPASGSALLRFAPRFFWAMMADGFLCVWRSTFDSSIILIKNPICFCCRTSLAYWCRPEFVNFRKYLLRLC